jgi:OOP family OmpA-OmpF porin
VQRPGCQPERRVPIVAKAPPAAAPAPAAVAAAPAAAPQKAENPNVKFEDVHFAFDKYALTDYAKTSLDNDVATINRLSHEYTNLLVDVSGHTDWIGSAAYNLALSERRANSVRDYLAHAGVESDKVHTFAYSLTRPVAPNTTTAGRALTRRAEVRTHAGQ